MYKKKFKVAIDQNHKKSKGLFLTIFFIWVALKVKKIYFVDLYQLFIC